MISYVKEGAKIAGTADFSVGRRIAIRLGYTDDPKIVSLTKASEQKNIFNDQAAYDEYCVAMNYLFVGFITQCSTEEPIEIKCENLAYVLRSVMVPNIGSMDDITVNYLFSPDGDSSLPEPRNTEKPDLLEGTGLELHPDVKALKLSAGKYTPDRTISVYELLSSWGKKLLHSLESKMKEFGDLYKPKNAWTATAYKIDNPAPAYTFYQNMAGLIPGMYVSSPSYKTTNTVGASTVTDWTAAGFRYNLGNGHFLEYYANPTLESSAGWENSTNAAMFGLSYAQEMAQIYGANLIGRLKEAKTKTK